MILDFSKKENVTLLNKYKKCRGIILVDRYLPELTPFNKVFIIDSLEDWKKVENQFPRDMITVRCDCPRGIEGKLPEGRTFSRDRVNEYIEEVKSKVPDGVIILEDMKQGTNERLHTKGGINLDIRINEQISIDYAGPSFDCGALTRNNSAHQTWNIPWEDVPFLKDFAINKYKIWQITQDRYVETAKKRIKFLLKENPQNSEEIFETMPKRFSGMEIQVFRDMRDKVIFPLWLQHNRLLHDGLKHFGVEINVVEDGRMVPMEITVPERFKSKVIEGDER